MQVTHPSLSRTSSTTSIDSADETMSNSTVTATRRTRKRFTHAQLVMLENLFHQNSHPSREDREAVAKAGSMEIKSVTIWFQNKRQTERKVAASTAAAANNANHAVPSSSPPPLSSRSGSTTCTARLSLDRVASRSELRSPAARTPSRRNPNGAIWDNMPSSPLVSPTSPPFREYVDFGKNPRTRRTLEWACAAARLAERDTPVSHKGGRTTRRQGLRKEASATDLDLTDEEADEAITPPSTWGKDDRRWAEQIGGGGAGGKQQPLPNGVEDDDMLKAALALCGLGRRSM